MAHRDTQQEALPSARDAIELWLDAAREYGDPIPEPKGQRFMTEISGANCLAEWLKGKPAEFACALAARIALRIAPILRDALCADEALRRARIILPSFRALAALNFAGAMPDRFGDMRQAAQAATRLAGDAIAEIFNEGQVNMIGSIEAAPEESLYIHEMESDRNAVGVASHAVDAIVRAVRAATEMIDAHSGLASIGAIVESVFEAANAAHWAVDGATGYQEFRSVADSIGEEEIQAPPHITEFWKAVEWDIVRLETSMEEGDRWTTSVESLSELQLWADGIPTWVSRCWSAFKGDLPLGEGWGVWTDWYEARLVGQRINPAVEMARVTIADNVWKRGPKEVNAAIANLKGSSDALSNNEDSKLPQNRDYHVALSFAGEQRGYVEEVARHLAARGIAVFYDGFEQAGLWGKDGAEAFHDVYAERAMYVAMFISKAYAAKAWTRYERQSAISRMLEEEGEYVLPIRFDETPIPGLPKTIFFLRAEDYSPAELSMVIAKKLGKAAFGDKASNVPPPRMTSYAGEVVFDYGSFNGRYVIGSGPVEFETMWTKASSQSIHVYNDPKSINGVALDGNASSIYEVLNATALDFTSRSRCPATGEIVVLRNVNGFYAAVQVLDIKDNRRGDDRDELRFRYAIQCDGTGNFSGFRDVLEQKLLDQ